MRRKIPVDLPPWAISEEEISNVDIPKGFLTNFKEYVNICSDAPSSFVIGVGLGVLAIASGQCNIVVQGDGDKSNQLPVRLWQALIGNSGQRKSKVMDLGLGILQRANCQFLLPSDSSLEALHDSIADTPICLLHQEELSGLFDAQTRSYTQGTQSYLLSLWQGTPKDRKTKANGLVVIQRPRFNILGAIPPEVFYKKTKNLDWKSGFLPRFLFWGGIREEWQDSGMCLPKYEEILANYLRSVQLKSDGVIYVPAQVSKPLYEWYFDNIECKAHTMLEDTYAGLLRLQEAGHIIASLIAVSRQDRPIRIGTSNRVMVNPDDMAATVQLLNFIKRTIEYISNKANQNSQSRDETSVLEIMLSSRKGCTVMELKEQLNLSLKEVKNLVRDLGEAGVIVGNFRHSKTSGRPAMEYHLTETARLKMGLK